MSQNLQDTLQSGRRQRRLQYDYGLCHRHNVYVERYLSSEQQVYGHRSVYAAGEVFLPFADGKKTTWFALSPSLSTNQEGSFSSVKVSPGTI